MIATDSFHIINLQADDAKSLSEMMVLNFDNFKRYFPITLSKNQSFTDSLSYIEEKRKENVSRNLFMNVSMNSFSPPAMAATSRYARFREMS